VIGAAHQRQGRPCQDASLGCSLSWGGSTLALMAVADGHGGTRYWRSDVGSRLACLVAREAVEAALPRTPLSDQKLWGEQLQQALPAAIWQRWLNAVQADWQRQREAGTQPFSALTYGCTLGLVLMAPDWWGCTGVGDWDLVGVDGNRKAVLLSQEEEHGGGAEATASLCQQQAAELFSPRAQLHSLTSTSSLQALVLSTDGVRKSCATDADFLSLCSQVVALQQSGELEEGLKHITAAGSGDDVSLAIGRRHNTPQTNTPQAGWRWRHRFTAMAALATTVSATAAALFSWPQGRDPVHAEMQRQCAQPNQIQINLTQRRAQFQQLLQAPEREAVLRQQAKHDPLGALIAASTEEPPAQACALLQQELAAQWEQARKTLQAQSAAGTPSASPSGTP
jgi:serine/threonine protein phosphatase PrpC